MKQNIRKIIHWVIAFFLFLFSLTGFASGGIASGILLLILTVFALPIRSIDAFWVKVLNGRKWIKYVLYIVVFIIGMAVYPVNETATTEVSTVDSASEESNEVADISSDDQPVQDARTTSIEAGDYAASENGGIGKTSESEMVSSKEDNTEEKKEEADSSSSIEKEQTVSAKKNSEDDSKKTSGKRENKKSKKGSKGGTVKKSENASVEESVKKIDEKPSDTSAVATTEAVPSNGVDPKEWPELAELNLPNETMLAIYNDYEASFEDEPEDIDEADAYEDKMAKEIGEKYGITADEADMVYGYVLINYEKVVNNGEEARTSYTVEHGELVSVIKNGSIAVVKVKIQPLLTNDMTIKQNYYNVCDMIRNQGLDSYQEVQYWAVADMTDGSESKVISFTVPKSTIDLIATTEFPDNTLGDYVEDLWVHPSLRE